MSISGVTASSGVTSRNVIGKTENSAVSSLRREKELLQEQLQNVRNGKDDPTTKQEKIKELTQEIQQIDQQITQVEAQEKQQQTEKTEETAKIKAKTQTSNSSNGVVLSDSLTNLVSAQGTASAIAKVESTQQKLVHEKTTYEGQIKYGIPGGSIKYQLETIAEDSAKIFKLNSNIGQKMGEAKRQLNSAAAAKTTIGSINRHTKEQKIPNRRAAAADDTMRDDENSSDATASQHESVDKSA